MSTITFNGLTMPVFNAFGFISTPEALKYALEQVEQFILMLHATMPREAQVIFNHKGLDQETQGVYLARSFDVAQDVNMTFHAKPAAMRWAINLTERNTLARALATIQRQPDHWISCLEKLGDAWELRCQQMEFDPETGEATHYHDLFKDPVTVLTSQVSAELIDRLSYLNTQDKWIAPIYLSKRMSAQYCADLGMGLITQLGTEIEEMLPLLRLLTGGVRPTGTAANSKKKPNSTTRAQEKGQVTSASDVLENRVEQFTYTAKLAPLHLRKGFINMTAAHWPFFSINNRTEVREIILKYDGNTDRKSSVWRLNPNNIARIVLSERAQIWLEDNFNTDDEIQVVATKRTNDEIEVELSLVK